MLVLDTAMLVGHLLLSPMKLLMGESVLLFVRHEANDSDCLPMTVLL